MPINIAGLYTNRIPTAAPAQSVCCCPACTGLECLDRTRFFAGQLLTESDLNNEQSYWLAKNRLHNRYLHGWGVVCGLQVVCAECDGWVTVKTGYAIDPCGNDIIVCEDQPFNVIKAIQACCAPAKSTNCSPLRYTPSPTCQDAIQSWCVTIEYQEQPSRLVTPLRQTTPKGDACRCADPCQTTPGTAAQPCGCNTPQPQTPTPATNGSCEPTRIVEGFKICVVPAPNPDTKENQPEPGTIDYQIELCLASLQQVLRCGTRSYHRDCRAGIPGGLQLSRHGQKRSRQDQCDSVRNRLHPRLAFRFRHPTIPTTTSTSCRASSMG